MTSKQQREVLVRRKARLFAQEIKNNPAFARKVPDDIIDWLKDDEIEAFRQHLITFGLQLRNDFLWEKA